MKKPLKENLEMLIKWMNKQLQKEGEDDYILLLNFHLIII